MKGESTLKIKDVVSTDAKGGVKLKFKQYQEAQQCTELQDDCGVESFKIVRTLISQVIFVWYWIRPRLIFLMCYSVSLSWLPFLHDTTTAKNFPPYQIPWSLASRPPPGPVYHRRTASDRMSQGSHQLSDQPSLVMESQWSSDLTLLF